MDIKIIYEDNDVLAVDKPAGIIVFEETKSKKQETNRVTVIDELIKKRPKLGEVGDLPRFGIVHRLDKDTSGILLVAKNTESLFFLQEQFKNKTALDSRFRGNDNEKGLEKILKKGYITLVEGVIKQDQGIIKTLIGRSPKDGKKQIIFSEGDKGWKNQREAITEYKVIRRFGNFTLLEIEIKTGRKHQIRCHMAYIQHPVAGDKMYGFKNSKIPEGLTRQFLHAGYLKIQLPSGETKEFKSELPDDLKLVLEKLKK